MTFNEYRQHDALGLAELVKKGAVTPEALLELAIQRTEAINPSINAVIHKLYDEARAAAPKVDHKAPFAGVPFLVKDLGAEIQGAPRHIGTKGYQRYVSTFDSFAVQKMRAAGLVVFGKTNVPELGLAPFTEPKLHGPSLNPWNTAHSTGGSSGGSAAAVAAGITPLATANDGGGSIRIPASCCGLVGLKTSRGRISWAPIYGEMWSGAAVEGCVSRSVRDSAAYLDAVAAPAPGDPYPFQKPERPYLQEVGAPPGVLRIAWSTAHTLGGAVDEACIKAVQKAVDMLRHEGHQVEEAALPFEETDLTEAFITIVAAEVAADLELMGQFLGRKVRPSDVEPETFALGLLGRAFSGADYALAKRRWNDVCRRVGAFHERYDVLVTPVLPRRPIRTGTLQSTSSERGLLAIVNTLRLGAVMKSTFNQSARKIYDYLPWTPFANITGQPSLSLPLYRTTEENLPVGVMCTARVGEDALLFRLAGQLEKMERWMEDVPG